MLHTLCALGGGEGGGSVSAGANERAQQLKRLLVERGHEVAVEGEHRTYFGAVGLGGEDAAIADGLAVLDVIAVLLDRDRAGAAYSWHEAGEEGVRRRVNLVAAALLDVGLQGEGPHVPLAPRRADDLDPAHGVLGKADDGRGLGGRWEGRG